MKQLIMLLCAVLLVSCQEETPKDHVVLTGKITNPNSDEIRVYNKTYSKTIKVNEDGTFSDTLKVEKGKYSFYDGNEGTTLFLENGYDLNMTLDTEMFDETIVYTGSGAENNNFLAKESLFMEQTLDGDYDILTSAELGVALRDAKDKITEFINKAEGIDTMITNSSHDRLDATIQSYQRYYGGIAKLREEFPKGSPSPSFEGYENFNGGATSLGDLKGKYVYVDVWATWCGPCKVEIPHLKELEAEYHDKNIAFVSMSIDDDKRHKGSWENAHKAWKKFVEEKELTGIQIYAPEGWESDFIKAYKINGIPRFILIDPDGKVVDPNAPRPSNPRLKEMLESLI
ncbi:AhpC/TSA family protein [Aureitalea sp. L0-47]|uniref:TlpA disulfide reductase family protein n=1 Tax=Aureitalea sp. L0-47 TaxID=2816962 RepID=UPI00223746BF|nr:TlpA disulfide reductase family protein [Aureitalea sp. L0-47]MCW5520807.1 AhpC/TSA family protein [Aureitalea sp. L0-47]